MKGLWYKIKSSAWSLAFLVVMALGMAWFVYNILRPTKNKTQYLEGVQGIQDREERLKALIRLHEELDL